MADACLVADESRKGFAALCAEVGIVAACSVGRRIGPYEYICYVCLWIPAHAVDEAAHFRIIVGLSRLDGALSRAKPDGHRVGGIHCCRCHGGGGEQEQYCQQSVHCTYIRVSETCRELHRNRCSSRLCHAGNVIYLGHSSFCTFCRCRRGMGHCVRCADLCGAW